MKDDEIKRHRKMIVSDLKKAANEHPELRKELKAAAKDIKKGDLIIPGEPTRGQS